MEHDVAVAEPSPAEIAPSDALASLSDSQYSKWRETGELPPADSTPATEEAKPADPPPAKESSEAVKTEPEPDKQQEKHTPGAEKRIKELLAKIKELEAKPAPAPREEAAAPKPKAEKLEAPAEPDPSKYETWGEYQKAEREYYRDLARYESRQAVEADRAQRAKEAETARVAETNKQIEESWKQRTAAVRKEHSDFDSVAFSADIPISAPMDQYILRSEHGARVLYHLGKNLEAARAIFQLDPIDAVRELVKIELSLQAPPAAPVKPKPTAAPKPVTELGGRNTVPEDEAEDAVAAGDFSRFQRVMNRRDLKKE